MSVRTTLPAIAVAGAISTLASVAAPAAAQPATATTPTTFCEPAPQATASAPANAVTYQVAFPNAAHHEARVRATWAAVPAGQPLVVRMARSSPGRYALHEFAKNVYDVRAEDSRGRELRVTRPDIHSWEVHGHDGTVRVTYTIFGDRADGTYLGVDRTHTHMNTPATFMFAPTLAERPVRLTVCAADSTWKVATQLVPTSDPYTFTAPHTQYFFDSPTEASDFELHEWPVTSGGRTQTIRVALHHAGTAEEAARYVDATRRIVAEQEAVFGELPEFDFGTYTFLADYLPWVYGDGMEHRNSTVVSSTRPLSTGMVGNLGTVSHEFFHAWNVERIRPASLEPFDFTEANMSPDLWLAEGFTQYYGNLTLARAGVVSDTVAARTMGGVANAIANGAGRRYFSPEEMSMQAPFVDAATSVDAQNKPNTFISYYTWGAGVALAADLELRSRFGKTLDDFMRAMWVEFGKPQKDYAPVRGYTVDDARRVMGSVAGDTAWANDFFAKYVTGTGSPDYARLLAGVGIHLEQTGAGKGWAGPAQWRTVEGEVLLVSPAIVGTPLYETGIDRGDRLVSIDGQPITTPEQAEERLAGRKPGDRVAVVYESRGTTRETTVVLGEDPRVEGVLFEAAGRPVTDAVRRARSGWLGAKRR
ncbi:MAG TPA: PDZ domain-containing protein [Gemmatimonadales bacterium]